jgi:hypothetical protein
MEIPIPIQLDKIDIQVKAVRDNKPLKDIVGFFEMTIFDGDNKPFIKVRGGTIKVKQFKKLPKPIFTVNAPAYKSAMVYRTSFIIESKSLWRDIEKTILDDFFQQTGGLSPEDFIKATEENVNPEDIPF